MIFQVILDEFWVDSGFKVLHVDNIDYRSRCKSLKSCLRHLVDWSDANPSHVPLLVRVEMKLETLIEFVERQDSSAADTIKLLVDNAAEVRMHYMHYMHYMRECCRMQRSSSYAPLGIYAEYT
jgi:hypothetical protein